MVDIHLNKYLVFVEWDCWGEGGGVMSFDDVCFL